MPYIKREAELNYANLNFDSKDLRNFKPREIETKFNSSLPSEEVEYAALDLHEDNSNVTTEKELNYAALNFHSDKSKKLKSILPKDSEIILNPSNAPNNTNEGRGNDVTTDNLSVNNDNQHTQRKKSSKWQISGLVVAGGICSILWIAAVIVWSKEYNISQKGINNMNCPPLPAPTYGSVKFTDGGNNNPEARFSCNAGFTLVQGDKVRVCQINKAKGAGVWNKQSPKCLAITCPSLMAPAYGLIRFTDGKNINSQATFTCNAGFTLVQGNRLRVCRVNKAKDAGVWDRPSPKCSAITCQPLTAPAYGSVRFTDGKTINSKAIFRCNAGFTHLQGDRYRNCRLNYAQNAANWDRRSPKCQNGLECIIDDGPHGRISNGGSPFSDRSMIKHGQITGLYIRSGDWVNCVSLIRGNGKHECYGKRHYEVKFKAGEYIISVKGSTGYVINQITFTTNLRSIGPYGGKGGERQFATNFRGRRLMYISGRRGYTLDQITFHLSC